MALAIVWFPGQVFRWWWVVVRRGSGDSGVLGVVVVIRVIIPVSQELSTRPSFITRAKRRCRFALHVVFSLHGTHYPGLSADLPVTPSLPLSFANASRTPGRKRFIPWTIQYIMRLESKYPHRAVYMTVLGGHPHEFE